MFSYISMAATRPDTLPKRDIDNWTTVYMA